MSVRRWEWTWRNLEDGEMEEDPNGSYVLHSDYAKLEARINELELVLGEAHALLRAALSQPQPPKEEGE